MMDAIYGSHGIALEQALLPSFLYARGLEGYMSKVWRHLSFWSSLKTSVISGPGMFWALL
jgi:hypothetical protein